MSWGCDSRRISTRQVTRSCCAFCTSMYIQYLRPCRIVIIHGTEIGIFLANFAAETPDSCTTHFRSSRWQFDGLAGQERGGRGGEGCVARMEHLTECNARHYRSITLSVIDFDCLDRILRAQIAGNYIRREIAIISMIVEEREKLGNSEWIYGLRINATRFTSLSDIFLEFSWIYKVHRFFDLIPRKRVFHFYVTWRADLAVVTIFTNRCVPLWYNYSRDTFYAREITTFAFENFFRHARTLGAIRFNSILKSDSLSTAMLPSRSFCSTFTLVRCKLNWSHVLTVCVTTEAQ